MASRVEGLQPRLSREEHLAQIKQERAQRLETQTQARVEKREQSKRRAEMRKEQWDSFWKNIRSGAEATWKKTVELGPKAVDFMKTKAGQGQDMLDSMVAGYRYKKQEKAAAKDVRERAMASVKQGEAALKAHKKEVGAHNRMMKKEEWDKKVEATKEKWKSNVTAAQEWGVGRVADAINKGRDIKHTYWDIPVNNYKVTRVHNRLTREQATLRHEIGMNAEEITMLMDRINELRSRNKQLNDQYKLLSQSGIDRGKMDAVLGTADLSRKAAWVNQGKADLQALFTMRSAV